MVEEQTQLDSVLDCFHVGMILLDATHFRIQHINSYAQTQLAEHQIFQSLLGQSLEEILPGNVCAVILSVLQDVKTRNQESKFDAVPFEGFFDTNKRTYWRITIQPLRASWLAMLSLEYALCITCEDVTQEVRARLHLDVISSISSTITGPHTLSHVLDCVLQTVHTYAGSSRCAILLIDRPRARYAEAQALERNVTVAAQMGLHLSAQKWHPHLSSSILLGRVEQAQHSLTIGDTSRAPEIHLPSLEGGGAAHRPRAVLCVPIFEQVISTRSSSTSTSEPVRRITGSIELYGEQPQRFSMDEIELLEHIADQAGLAIQNARLFQEREQFARAERRSAHQRAYVMQAIPDGVIIVDARWRIAETNTAIRKLLGWPQESNALSGVSLAQALRQSKAKLPPFLTQICDPVSEFEHRASSGHIDEFKMQDACGRSCTVRCSYTAICDDLGDTFAFAISFHDVTMQVEARERVEAEVVTRTHELAERNSALQQAQLALETERARLEVLIERLPSGVLLVSAFDASIITINRYAAQLLRSIGVTMPEIVHARQLIGANIEILLRQTTMYDSSGSIVPYREQPLALALYRGEASESELHVEDTEDQPLYLLANAAPLRTPDGTVTSAILVLRDITTLKKLERARENFFTAMAHELKTPLANVRAHLSALLMSDVKWSVEDQNDFIQAADEQIERMIGMIHRVLSASRVEVGALRPILEPFFLPELLEDLQERLAALIHSSRRRLEFRVEANLPAIEADYELIMSVFTNLLSNAFRYTPEHGVVMLEAQQVLDPASMHVTGIRISVRDNGPGIPAEIQKRLFKRFSTYPSPGHAAQATTKEESFQWSLTSGLGLYISKGIIEAHRSSLELTSSPGQGTCFSFTLSVVGGSQSSDTACEVSQSGLSTISAHG